MMNWFARRGWWIVGVVLMLLSVPANGQDYQSVKFNRGQSVSQWYILNYGYESFTEFRGWAYENFTKLNPGATFTNLKVGHVYKLPIPSFTRNSPLLQTESSNVERRVRYLELLAAKERQVNYVNLLNSQIDTLQSVVNERNAMFQDVFMTLVASYNAEYNAGAEDIAWLDWCAEHLVIMLRADKTAIEYLDGQPLVKEHMIRYIKESL